MCGKTIWFLHALEARRNSCLSTIAGRLSRDGFLHTGLEHCASGPGADAQRRGNLTPAPAGLPQFDHCGTVEDGPGPANCRSALRPVHPGMLDAGDYSLADNIAF